MRISEKIKRYIVSKQKEGKIKPGDKLPSYNTLCKKFKASYASIQYAFREFEKEGLVERIQGVGTFLRGKTPLEVDMYLNSRSFPKEIFEKIINEKVQQKNLYLKVQIKDIKEVSKKKKNLYNFLTKKKVIICEDSYPPYLHIGSVLDFSSFSDYKTVISSIHPHMRVGSTTLLPFFCFSYQMAFNPKIFKKLNISEKILDESSTKLEWWDEYVKICKKNNMAPAIKNWNFHALWLFPLLPLVPLLINERDSYLNLLSLPFFNTNAGRKTLQVLKQTQTVLGETIEKNFFSEDCGVILDVGSWITVHYKTKWKMSLDSFRIKPYLFKDKKICLINVQCLQVGVHYSLKPDEKSRIWELLKILISKDFQKKLVALTGAISIRQDIEIEEHEWCKRKDFRVFFPTNKDIIINYYSIFDHEVRAAISALYEQYEFFNADLDQIVENMDYKIKSMLDPL